MSSLRESLGCGAMGDPSPRAIRHESPNDSQSEPWGTVDVVELADQPSCANCGAACQQSRDGLTQRCNWCSSLMERDPDVEHVVNGKRMIVRTWSREALT